MLLIVDSLDKCDGQENQVSILSAFKYALLKLRVSLPTLYLLIMSHPEPAICQSFEHDLTSTNHHIVLNNSYDPDRDITIFLRSSFSDILCQRCRHFKYIIYPWIPADSPGSYLNPSIEPKYGWISGLPRLSLSVTVPTPHTTSTQCWLCKTQTTAQQINNCMQRIQWWPAPISLFLINCMKDRIFIEITTATFKWWCFEAWNLKSWPGCVQTFLKFPTISWMADM